MPFMDFTGKKIMVVGASSGIGRQLSVLLSELGAEVVLVGRSEEKLERVKSELRNSDIHMTISYDVKNTDECKTVFESAVQDGKKLNGLAYCTGIAKAVPLRVISLAEFNNIFYTNFFGFINFVSYYSKKKYNDGGSIVGISAVNAHIPQKCMTLYAGSKAALEAAVKTMAIELAEQRIRINAIIPGAVDTPMSEAVNKDMLNSIVSKQLLGMQNPRQIADYIAFLLSENSSAVTGRSLYADGGMLGQ